MSFHADEIESTKDIMKDITRVVNEQRPGLGVTKAYGLCDCCLPCRITAAARCRPIIVKLSDGSELDLIDLDCTESRVMLFTKELLTDGGFDGVVRHRWSAEEHPQGWTGEALREAFGEPPTGEEFYESVVEALRLLREHNFFYDAPRRA